MVKKTESQSQENYGVLVELKESMDNMRGSLELFASQQTAENVRIHARIDATQEKFISAVSGLKDNTQIAIEKLSAKGQISWQLIFTATAVLVGVVSAVGTVGYQITESRIHQVEIRNEADREIRESQIQMGAERDQFIVKMIERNREDFTRFMDKK